MKVKPLKDKKLISHLFSLVEKEGAGGFGESYKPTKAYKHPVVPGFYAVTAGEDWAWVVLDGEKPQVWDAADTFYDGDVDFLEVTLREDGTWVYPDEEDESPVWECMDQYDEKNGGYEPTQFKPGQTLYPILFHPNVPGGWTVYDASGKYSEYFQC